MGVGTASFAVFTWYIRLDIYPDGMKKFLALVFAVGVLVALPAVTPGYVCSGGTICID